MISVNIVGEFFLKKNSFILNTLFNFPGTGITVVFGPSGVGKSTLLKFLLGLKFIKNAELFFKNVWLQKKSLFVLPSSRNFGYVSQNSILFPNLSVEDNLFYGYARTQLERRYIDVAEVFDVFCLKTLVKKKHFFLSGGERQRLVIARALFLNSECLLLDEPVSSLDRVVSSEILSYLRYINDKFKIPIVLVSHDIFDLNFLADCYFELKKNIVF